MKINYISSDDFTINLKMLSNPTCYWAIEERRFNSSFFFSEAARLFPEATALYIQGSSISKDVLKLVKAYNREEHSLFMKGNVEAMFGTNKASLFCCEFSGCLLSELERFTYIYAEPEICDHLAVFLDESPILEFYDFPQNEIWLAESINEERVRDLAYSLGSSYYKQSSGQEGRSNL